MLFHIMDVNNGGEIIAKIESNNGKNALKKFIREYSLTIGFYEIKKRDNNTFNNNNCYDFFYA